MVPQYHSSSMTRTTRNLLLAGLAIALIGLLLVLGPNLQQIELRPARINPDPPAGVESATPSLGTNPTGAGGFAIFLRILFTAAVAGLAFIIVGAIFKREFRAYLLVFAALCLMVLGFYFFWENAPRAEPELPAQEATGFFDLLEDRPTAEAVDEAPPPGWSFSAVAIAVSVGVAVLLAIIWVKLVPRWRNRTADDGKTELEELIETVGAAADEIQLGGDPRSAVLRCYREMIRIFTKQKTIDHVHLTARELAAALHRVGFRTTHVDQLTEIFELVRYGNRGGEPLAEQAIACLEAIREAYAAP